MLIRFSTFRYVKNFKNYQRQENLSPTAVTLELLLYIVFFSAIYSKFFLYLTPNYTVPHWHFKFCGDKPYTYNTCTSMIWIMDALSQ